MAPEILCAILSTLHSQHGRVVVAYVFRPSNPENRVNSQNGTVLLSTEKSGFSHDLVCALLFRHRYFLCL
jgi:hypothetical protein